jgi:hypothetical protein
VPKAELSWLEASWAKPAARSSSLRINVSMDKAHAVRNAAEVRSLLEKSGKVLAVFQGHSHKNDYQQIAGIHYTTLVAMVEGSGAENNGYTMLDVLPTARCALNGFRKQMNRTLNHA